MTTFGRPRPVLMPPPEPTGGSAGVTEITNRILDASRRRDPAAVRHGFDQATAILGLAGCIDAVLLPVMRQIGISWSAGRCDIDQERLTTEATRSWLDSRSAFAPRPRYPDPILLACGPRDQHTIGMESLALLLRFQGWPCRVLGARTSVFDLLTAARATGPIAVVVVSHLAAARPYAAAAVNEAHRQGHRVFFAGNAFDSEPARTDVAGGYLGSSVTAATAQLNQTLVGPTH